MRFVTVIVMPRRCNEQRQHRNVVLQQRTVLEDTRGVYIAKCRVMSHELDGVDGNGDNVRELGSWNS